MKERPQSVTVICWILIAMNGLALMWLPMSLRMVSTKPELRRILEQSPVPIPIQHVLSFAGIAVTLTGAIAMLNGRNWGRWLYAIWMILSIIFGLVTSPLKLMIIPGILIFGVIAFFLFRPAANQYFSATGGGQGPEGA